jgi:hypothetical protein
MYNFWGSSVFSRRAARVSTNDFGEDRKSGDKEATEGLVVTTFAMLGAKALAV